MRNNMKLERLRRRVVDTEAKAADAVGTVDFPHRYKVFQQRTRVLQRAESNGDRNREVNEQRNRAEARV